jgi:hypothetical protein
MFGKTQKQRQAEADAWNNWRPGQMGRKSWSPFSKEIPPMRDAEGRPMKNYDEIDWEKWQQEIEQGLWPPK